MSANLKTIANKTNTQILNKESSTINSQFSEDNKERNEDLSSIFKSITSTNNRLDNLEKENKMLSEELTDTRNRENKLLNRFSWLIQIINIGSVLLIIMSLILFIDSFYPFYKKLTSNSTGATIVIGIIGGTIAGAIIALWCKFNKYVQEIILREKS